MTNGNGHWSDQVAANIKAQIAEQAATLKFEVGKTYFTRSACDHNCVFSYTVVRRTAKCVWLKEDGKHASDTVVRRSISLGPIGGVTYDNAEHCYPDGRYSMCPVLTAERCR